MTDQERGPRPAVSDQPVERRCTGTERRGTGQYLLLAEAASLSSRPIGDLERGINQTARKETARLLADALQSAELQEKLRRQVRELGDEDLAALNQKREGAWNALSRQEQERLTEQRRTMVPRAAGGSTKGRP